MTRNQAKANLESLGFGDNITDEMITNYLNQVNGETQKEKDKAEQFKKDADKVKELTAQLEEIQNANLSDIDKANKANEEAKNEIATLKAEIAHMQTLKALADQGITGDDAENLINADGSLNLDTLGKIISDREAKAAVLKEQEIANGSTNPNGGSGTNQETNDKPLDVQFAESISFGNTASEDAKDFYKL